MPIQQEATIVVPSEDPKKKKTEEKAPDATDEKPKSKDDADSDDLVSAALGRKYGGIASLTSFVHSPMRTKGVWYPDKTKATDKDPPLYLHISGKTQAMVDAAVTEINDKIAADLGPLVEDRRRDDKPRERVSLLGL